jgi:ATP-dependent RNA helicase RhlE
MHGDKTQGAREKALKRFEAGKVSTLVATDVAARGLDLDRITHVINFDPPAEGKDYVHRVGRTGRAGRDGTGITLVLPEQQADVSRVAARVGEVDQFETQGMKVAAPRVVYTSRRGRNDRWGRRGPRRKI